MGFRVVITRPAVDDLAEIVRFISRDNAAAGERTGFRLVEAAESLGELPLRGRIVPERKHRDCREVILKPYRIVYRVKEEEKLVEVLRFLAWRTRNAGN
jgi:addiction module RelE/StbE family toxin